MEKQPDVFIFAGEQSGDKLASSLIADLKKEKPDIYITGVAGPSMREQGMHPIMKMESFQTMGFVDVLRRLPFFFSSFFKIKRAILDSNPKMVILVDYPGFNLRLARALKKAGFKAPIIQYVCPSVWAWGKKRIPLMEQYLDSLMTILPFEPALFDSKKITSSYVGHPLLTQTAITKKTVPDENECSLALFPGSRSHEITNNLPIMLKAASTIKAQKPFLNITIVAAHKKAEGLIKHALDQAHFKAAVRPHSQLQNVLANTNLAIATSGTITLEIALAEIPCVVVYYVSKLDVILAKHLFKVDLPHFSLPNILAKKELYPELFGPNLTLENLTCKVTALIENPTIYKRMKQGCKSLKQSLNPEQQLLPIHFLKKHYSSLLKK